jgi:hypothetical protein
VIDNFDALLTCQGFDCDLIAENPAEPFAHIDLNHLPSCSVPISLAKDAIENSILRPSTSKA